MKEQFYVRRNKKTPIGDGDAVPLTFATFPIPVEIRRTPKGDGKQLRYIRNIFPVENFIFDQA